MSKQFTFCSAETTEMSKQFTFLLAETTEMSKQTGIMSKQFAFLLAEITEMSKQTGIMSKQFAFLLIKSLITNSELFLGLTHDDEKTTTPGQSRTRRNKRLREFLRK
jgi:hypothetical protein